MRRIVHTYSPLVVLDLVLDYCVYLQLAGAFYMYLQDLFEDLVLPLDNQTKHDIEGTELNIFILHL